LGVAAGLAMSDPVETPNMIMTFEDKVKLLSRTSARKKLLAVFIFLIGMCFLIRYSFYLQNTEAKMVLLKKKQTLNQFRPLRELQDIENEHALLLNQRMRLRDLAENMLTSASTVEIWKTLPDKVTLMDLRYGDMNAGSRMKSVARKRVRLTGLVEGPPELANVLLGDLIVKWRGKPLFHEVELVKTYAERMVDGNVTVFEIRLIVAANR
jgi:hypothetical protein